MAIGRSARLKGLGRALRAQRLAVGLSQEEVSARTGVHPTYLSSLENGRRNPTVEVLFRLADALAVPAAQLLAQAEAP